MKNLLKKYNDLGCHLVVVLTNGDKLEQSNYSNFEILEDCFIFSSVDKNSEIYPYSSIFKIVADEEVPA